MNNNYINGNDPQNQAKCKTGTKVVFYIFGVFCSLLSLMALLVVFTTLFGYDKETVGTVTKIDRNRFSEKYEVVIEYSVDNVKKTKMLYLDKVPLKAFKNDKVEVKYSSKNNNVYFPAFESMSEQISMLLITMTIASVCFIAPHNSNKAVDKFLSLERKVRK